MKNNSKYTKNKEKWLDIYNSCKYKLYQFKKKIITIFVIYQNKNFILSLNTFKKLKIEKLTILDKYILKNFKTTFTFLNLVNNKNMISRLKKRKNLNRYDKFENNFYKKVQNGFIKLSKKNKNHYQIIDSNLEISHNKSLIIKKINRLIK